MWYKFQKWYESLKQRYLIMFYLILAVLAYFFVKEELVFLVWVILFLPFSYSIVISGMKSGRRIRPEDDPSGNSNIKKKFYEHM